MKRFVAVVMMFVCLAFSMALVGCGQTKDKEPEPYTKMMKSIEDENIDRLSSNLFHSFPSTTAPPLLGLLPFYGPCLRHRRQQSFPLFWPDPENKNHILPSGLPH